MLSADGLAAAAAASQAEPPVEAMGWLRERMRDMHDLTHVVTGYGSDPFGELCLLGFNFGQTGHPGMGAIAAMFCLSAGFGRRGRAAWRGVLEGWRHGRAALPLAAVAWEAALDRPLDRLRQELQVALPTCDRGVRA